MRRRPLSPQLTVRQPEHSRGVAYPNDSNRLRHGRRPRVVARPCLLREESLRGLEELDFAGIAIGGFYNDANPAPSADPNLKLRMFEDGCVISYDITTHHLSAILPGGGQATLTADGGVTVNGDTTINGNLQVTGNNTVLGSQSVSGTSYSKGNFNTDGDVNAGGISLKTHTHSGVQTGGGNTGGPQ